MIRKSRFDVHEVKAAAVGRWRMIFTVLANDALAAAMKRAPMHVRCPVHGGENKFRLFRNWEITGGGVCSCVSARTDGLSVLMWINGWSFFEALDNVARVLGFKLSPGHGATPAPRMPELKVPEFAKANENWWHYHRQFQRLQQIWDHSKPATQAEPVLRYLERRGLGGAVLHTDTFRYCPDLSFRDEATRRYSHHPALLALVTDPQGGPITLHRTYLTEQGDKAFGPESKRLMPYPDCIKLTGGAIRAATVRNGVLGITEGIETAWAVQIATLMPVWPVISASLVEAFVPPQGIVKVVNWVDKDRSRAGERAAEKLGERLHALGVVYEQRVPSMAIPQASKSLDWADVLARYGLDGFKAEAERSKVG